MPRAGGCKFCGFPFRFFSDTLAGEAFADASAAKSRFAELDGGEYAAMMVDKDMISSEAASKVPFELLVLGSYM